MKANRGQWPNVTAKHCANPTCGKRFIPGNSAWPCCSKTCWLAVKCRGDAEDHKRIAGELIVGLGALGVEGQAALELIRQLGIDQVQRNLAWCADRGLRGGRAVVAITLDDAHTPAAETPPLFPIGGAA